MSSKPVLSDWAIIRLSRTDRPGRPRYHFTGIGHGHPRLPDGVQIVTTEVQEIGKDGKWGRTKSRVYRLGHHLSRSEFTRELATDVVDILRYAINRTYNIGRMPIELEWISIEDWRELSTGERDVKKPVDALPGSFPMPEGNATAPKKARKK